MPNPYPEQAVNCFRLPDGSTALMTDVVEPADISRMKLEIMAIQHGLGVRADGLIGPETRKAFQRLAENR